MSRWFRMYDCLLDDPKVQRLPDRFFKVWVNLLCVASRNDGQLPAIDDLSFLLRMSAEDMQKAVDYLSSAGLLDASEDGYAPHKWAERQYKSDVSTDRVKRFRERSMKQPSTVSETSPDTDTDTDTETEKKEEPRKRDNAPRKKKTALPENFQVSDRVNAWAKLKGFDQLQEHLESFISKSKAKGYTYIDWDEALMGAIRDDWAGLRKANNRAPPKPKLQEIFTDKTYTDTPEEKISWLR